MNPTEVTAVIITFNEERNIARCLQSVEGIASTTVVVDSFSTDSTAELCMQHSNVKFVQREWGGYSDQKNYANTLVQSPFILSLDADEVLSKELGQAVMDLSPEPNTAYAVHRSTIYGKKRIRYSGWQNDRHVRLFPKAHAKWSDDVVHERIVLEPVTRIVNLAGRLDHYSYASVRDHVERARKYGLLAAENEVGTSYGRLLAKCILRPPLRFMRHYVLKLGFLDGLTGLVISAITAYGTYVKYRAALRLKSLGVQHSSETRLLDTPDE